MSKVFYILSAVLEGNSMIAFGEIIKEVDSGGLYHQIFSDNLNFNIGAGKQAELEDLFVSLVDKDKNHLDLVALISVTDPGSEHDQTYQLAINNVIKDLKVELAATGEIKLQIVGDLIPTRRVKDIANDEDAFKEAAKIKIGN